MDRVHSIMFLVMLKWSYSFLRNHNTNMKKGHPVKEWVKRKTAPERVNKMKIKISSTQLTIIVVVFHYYSIIILTLKMFLGRLENVCRGPDASIKLKIEEVHKQF